MCVHTCLPIYIAWTTNSECLLNYVFSRSRCPLSGVSCLIEDLIFYIFHVWNHNSWITIKASAEVQQPILCRERWSLALIPTDKLLAKFPNALLPEARSMATHISSCAHALRRHRSDVSQFIVGAMQQCVSQSNLLAWLIIYILVISRKETQPSGYSLCER